MSKKPQTITDKPQLHYLKIHSKEITTKEGAKFTRYFAYICNPNWEDTYRNITDKTTGETMRIPCSITIHFTKECEAKLVVNKCEFPAKVTLLDEHYFITDDKNKDGVYKTRNDGTKVKVAVIVDYNSFEHFSAPKLTFDNLYE